MLTCRDLLCAVRRFAGPLFLVAALAAGFAGWTSARAETPAPGPAEGLVQEALHCEIDGRLAQRQQLLQLALVRYPDCESAYWHQGFVRQDGQWLSLDQIERYHKADSRFVEYRSRRAEAEDNVDEQIALARWCRRNHLPQQERAHWTRVLYLEPEHSLALKALGWRQSDGRWMPADEFHRQQQADKEAARALQRWKPTVTRLRADMVGGDRVQSRSARRELLAISDPEAIGALETVLTVEKVSPNVGPERERISRELYLAFVAVLADMPEQAATDGVLRHAVLAPFSDVRCAAAEGLVGRQLESYVPAMLEAMYSFRAEEQVYWTESNMLAHRVMFIEEDQWTKREFSVETQFIIGGRLLLGPNANRAVVDAATGQLYRQMHRMYSEHTLHSGELNKRICTALRITTQEPLADTPQDWWNWWDDANEYARPEKPVYRRDYRQTATATIPTPRGPWGYSCFAAGTLVWTIDGPRPIEQIQVGDRLLSQDPASGELTHKPVLHTTLGPKAELVRLQTAVDTLDCTGGHPFWVAGEGWVQARQLISGSQLHGVVGSSAVSLVEAGKTEHPHNLIVADFHTYFVGEGKLLVHDVTQRQATNTAVPGLPLR